MKASSGFTVVELLATVVFLSVVATIGFDRYQAVQTVHRDQDRKTAVNAIHHNLEEIVRSKLGGYPRVLNANILTAIDKSLLVDPNGNKIGTSASDYRYEPSGCSGGEVCRGYRLVANLEKERDYVKTSPDN